MHRAFRLDDEVEVIALDGVVHDPHAEAEAHCAQRCLDDFRPAVSAQIPDAGLHALRDMDRTMARQIGPRQVRYSRPVEPGVRAGPRSPRSLAASAPLRERELELSRHGYLNSR